MFSKIYLIALVVCFILMSVFTFYSASWLGSITRPQDVAANYKYFSGLSWYFLWFSSVVLLILANVLLWKTRRLWAFWTSFIYFAFFVILQTFWLDRAFAGYQEQTGLKESSFTLSPLVGVSLLVAVAFIVFFNQFVIVRMQEKMFPPVLPIDESTQGDLAISENEEEKTPSTE